jgi:diacylglycerol kinase (ATP)
MKIRVIVNPKAGAGSGGRKIAAITRALTESGVDHQVVETRAPGDATELAQRARVDGVGVTVVVGGDGTLNEVAQAYLDETGAPLEGPALAMIPAGTGGDFRRAAELETDVVRAVRRVVEGPPRPLDLASVDVRGERGEPVRRAFLNIASFGVSGTIDRIVNQSPKWMGGRLAFAIGSVRAMSSYRNERVTITVDGTPWYEGRIVVAALANGRYFGGGMCIAPDARLSDGLLDVVVLGDLSFGESLRLSPDLYGGKHIGLPKVLATRGVRVEATPADDRPVWVDTDGETPGRLPLAARVFPAALSFRG